MKTSSVKTGQKEVSKNNPLITAYFSIYMKHYYAPAPPFIKEEARDLFDSLLKYYGFSQVIPLMQEAFNTYTPTDKFPKPMMLFVAKKLTTQASFVLKSVVYDNDILNTLPLLPYDVVTGKKCHYTQASSLPIEVRNKYVDDVREWFGTVYTVSDSKIKEPIYNALAYWRTLMFPEFHVDNLLYSKSCAERIFADNVEK